MVIADFYILGFGDFEILGFLLGCKNLSKEQ